LENRPSLSPDKDLVMRQRYSTSPPNASTRQLHSHEESINSPAQPISLTRQLLPPPPTSSTFLNHLDASSLSPGLQVSLFLVKVVTVLHPCSPVAVRPWFLYPLLLLAAITLRAHDLRVQAFSTLLHLILVGLGMKLGVLCTWHGDFAMGV
jgi:hypothetical protein